MTDGCSPGMEKLTLPSREELIRRVKEGLTSYSRPAELASFSYDGRRQLHFDRSQLVWCSPNAPNQPIHLLVYMTMVRNGTSQPKTFSSTPTCDGASNPLFKSREN